MNMANVKDESGRTISQQESIYKKELIESFHFIG
jgi:hypothetical protein